MNALLNRISSAGLILNRTGADGWLHLVPKGELFHPEAGVTQVLDDTALDAILANLHADAAKLGNRWPGLYAGEEHFIYDSEKSSQAFWWGKEFEKRADGIWGRGDETDIGAAALQNKRFKFTSFVCDPNQPGALEKLDGNRARVRRIDTVGFTNFANGKHLLTPITNRHTLPGESTAATSAATVADNQNQTQKNKMKLIANRLGLSADASEDALLGELAKLENRAKAADDTAAATAALTAERDVLKNRVTELLAEQIDADIAAAGITEETTIVKLKPVLMPMKNRAERVDFLALMQPVVKVEVKAPLTNRAAAKVPGGKPGEEKNAKHEAQRAAIIANRAGELQKSHPGRSIMSAFNAAQQAVDNEIATGALVLK